MYFTLKYVCFVFFLQKLYFQLSVFFVFCVYNQDCLGLKHLQNNFLWTVFGRLKHNL